MESTERGRASCSQTATAARALPTGAVGGDGRDVLDAADLHARARERTERRLRAGAGRLRVGAADRTQLDVQRVDAELLAARGDVRRASRRTASSRRGPPSPSCHQ